MQIRNHVETDKLENTILKQLVQHLQRDFALLQPQIELTNKQAASTPASQKEFENKIKNLEKSLSAEVYKLKSRLNSSQNQ